MIRMISNNPSKRKINTHREITFEFEYENANDIALIEKIIRLCAEQPICENCENFYTQGCLGGYMACTCKIHGNLESLDNPHYDMDGNKCSDYIRKLNNN